MDKDYKNKYKKLKLSQVDSKVSSKLISFVNNVATGKVTSSATYSLSRLISKTNKGTLAFYTLATDLSTNNFNLKKFSGKNALKTVLNDYSSKNYIARNSVTSSDLESASNNGKAILRVKMQDKKWHFIAISKVSSNKVTIYMIKNQRK